MKRLRGRTRNRGEEEEEETEEDGEDWQQAGEEKTKTHNQDHGGGSFEYVTTR